MVALNKSYNLYSGLGAATLMLALGQAYPALAEDWRERMREPSELRGSLTAAMPEEAPTIALRGGIRLGHTSNAEADFEEVPSPYLKADQELRLRRLVGDTEFGLSLRGTITRVARAEGIEYAETEARAGVAHSFASGATVGAEVGYRFEDDRGFRSHDTGVAIDAGWTLREVSPFLTATVNDISHDDIEFVPGLVDTGDNDRLRLGVEAGVEVPLGGGLRGSLSLGHLDQMYRHEVDLAGIRRSSRSAYVRAGIAVESGRFAGEAALTALGRDYDEPLYPETAVLLGEAELTWRPDDATLLTGRYFGDLEETPVYGVRNVMTHSGVLALARDIGAGLTATGAVYVDREHYLGTDRTDTTIGGGLELAYGLDATTSFDVALQYERLSSTLIIDPVEVWKVSMGINYAFLD